MRLYNDKYLPRTLYIELWNNRSSLYSALEIESASIVTTITFVNNDYDC